MPSVFSQLWACRRHNACFYRNDRTRMAPIYLRYPFDLRQMMDAERSACVVTDAMPSIAVIHTITGALDFL